MKINGQILNETIKSQIIGEAIGSFLKNQNIEEIRDNFGISGFNLDNWDDIIKNKKLSKSYKTEIIILSLEAIISCIKENKIVYNQNKIFKKYNDWYNYKFYNEEPELFDKISLLRYKNLLLSNDYDDALIKSIAFMHNNNQIFDINNQAINSNSSSALIRNIPISFFAKNDTEAFVFGALHTSLIQGGIINIYSGGILSLFTYRLSRSLRKLRKEWSSQDQKLRDSKSLKIYIRENIDIINIIDKTLLILDKFQEKEIILEKFELLKTKINDFKQKDLYFNDYELHEEFGDDNNMLTLMVVSIYLANTSISFDQCIERAANNNFDKSYLCSLTSSFYYLMNKDTRFEYFFNQIEEAEDIDELLVNFKNNYLEENFMQIGNNDISNDEMNMFLQIKKYEKIEIVKKERKTIIDLIKNIFKF